VSGEIIIGKAVDISGTLFDLERKRCENSLSYFIRAAWHVVEPGQEYLHNWHIDYIAEHLTAITDGHVLEDGTPYNRLLINVPPGAMKSMILNIFWPAWEWGPCNLPHMRYLCAAHQQGLAIRDSTKMRRLVMSDWYQQYWGDRVKLTGDQNAKTKFENTATGFREAMAAGSITGSRGDRVIIDDPHSVEGASSDAMRATTLEWFTEAVPSRLNNPKTSAIVVIMQRLHEEDVSGIILDRKGFKGTYDHICLPMRFETWRAGIQTKLGFEDPRTVEGELLFPARFPKAVVDRDEAAMGPYATAGQMQQAPTPRGGGIIKDSWWQLWDHSAFPPLDYIVASLDTAYSSKAEAKGDFSAMTVWGVWSGDPHNATTRSMDRYGRPYEGSINSTFAPELDAVPRVMLMYAWAERLELHELVQKVAKDCKDLKVDKVLIENKAAGHSVAQEIRRLFAHEKFAVQMYDPKSIDKLGRLYSVQHLFAEGMVFAPNRDYAEQVIRQVSTFPRAKHDDLVDTVSMGLRHLRDMGLLTRSPERLAEINEYKTEYGAGPAPLYAV
jgi:predicted phage terminase large subunit-like protein